MRALPSDSNGSASAGPREAARPGGVLRRSFMVAVTNPKGYLFFLALLPAFIDLQAPAPAQYLALALTFAAFDGAVLLLYASAGVLSAARLHKAKKARWLDIGSGVALMAMALALALWQLDRG